MSIFNTNCLEKNIMSRHPVCPKSSESSENNYSPQPLSICKDCPNFSFMTCGLDNKNIGRNRAENLQNLY